MTHLYRILTISMTHLYRIFLTCPLPSHKRSRRRTPGASHSSRHTDTRPSPWRYTGTHLWPLHSTSHIFPEYIGTSVRKNSSLCGMSMMMQAHAAHALFFYGDPCTTNCIGLSKKRPPAPYPDVLSSICSCMHKSTAPAALLCQAPCKQKTDLKISVELILRAHMPNLTSACYAQITQSSFSVPVVVRVLVDGTEVHSAVMKPGYKHSVRGVQTSEGLKQLVFAPPRVAVSSGKPIRHLCC